MIMYLSIVFDPWLLTFKIKKKPCPIEHLVNSGILYWELGKRKNWLVSITCRKEQSLSSLYPTSLISQRTYSEGCYAWILEVQDSSHLTLTKVALFRMWLNLIISCSRENKSALNQCLINNIFWEKKNINSIRGASLFCVWSLIHKYGELKAHLIKIKIISLYCLFRLSYEKAVKTEMFNICEISF